jgi:hypothetical protein
LKRTSSRQLAAGNIFLLPLQHGMSHKDISKTSHSLKPILSPRYTWAVNASPSL